MVRHSDRHTVVPRRIDRRWLRRCRIFWWSSLSDYFFLGAEIGSVFFGFSSIGDNIMKTESPHTNPQNAPNTDGRSLAKKAVATAAAAFSSNFLSLATPPNDNNNNSRNACAFSPPLFHFFLPLHFSLIVLIGKQIVITKIILALHLSFMRECHRKCNIPWCELLKRLGIIKCCWQHW